MGSPGRRPTIRGNSAWSAAMKKISAAVVVALLATCRPGAAQTTSEGLAAFAGGDYARAFQILKPLAESPGPADPAAAFFLATMYENGLGGDPDVQHAC